jgi:hypothetical protein
MDRSRVESTCDKRAWWIVTTAYPDFRLFVQVALSQLIDVPKDHPDRYSVRARFSQLVADFVLCRPDMSIVAVIELDDRSHEHPVRQAADARKTKALVDAGLKLVRIPKGQLPSAEALRTIIDGNGELLSRVTQRIEFRLPPPESDPGSGQEFGTAAAESQEIEHGMLNSREFHRVVMKTALGAFVVVLGWVAYAYMIPPLLQNSLQSLAPKPQPVSRIVSQMPVSVAAPPAFSVRAMSEPTADDLATKRQAELQAATELRRQRDRAWAVYYVAPASCEHPVDWNAQVECGNQYIRAKKSFEEKWSKDHGETISTEPGIVLDNLSLGGPQR